MDTFVWHVCKKELLAVFLFDVHPGPRKEHAAIP